MLKDNSIENNLKKFVLMSMFICLFVTVFVVHMRVRYYGDDWFYHRFSQFDFSYYLKRNIDHYFKANGRVVVHVLATFFLSMPLVVWAFVNTGFICVMTWWIVVLSSEEKNISQYVMGTLIALFVLSTLDGNITGQSMYWITGSFNYTYPLFMVIGLIFFHYRYEDKKRPFGFYILAFLAGASVEQAGMMAFGFLFLDFLYNLVVIKKKIEKENIWVMVLTFVGLLTVVLAPATFLRFSIEERQTSSMFELIKYNINAQGTTFLFSRVMLPTHILTFVAIAIAFRFRIKQGERLKKLEMLIACLSIISFLGIIYQFIARGAYIDYPVFVWKYFVLFAIIGVAYVITIIYGAYIMYKYSAYRYKHLPAILIIIGVGSLVMMWVSPVFGFRNLLFSIFILTLYSLILMQLEKKYSVLLLIWGIYFYLNFEPIYGSVLITMFFFSIISQLNDTNIDKRYVKKELILIGIIGLIIGKSFLVTYRGYSANAYTYDVNQKMVTQYIEEEQPITQLKMPNNKYRWVMPYENNYYDVYYKLYLGIDTEEKIDWVE